MAAAVRAIAACPVCRRRAAGGRLVIGEGDPRADIVFVGEAPGRQEAASGRPFVGRAGRWLRMEIQRAGLSGCAIYLTNVVPYRPASGAVRARDIEHGRTHVIRLLDAIRPRLVVLLGATACRGVLNERGTLSRRHGTFVVRDDTRFFITFHPAAAARFPAVRRKALRDFRRLAKVVLEGNFAGLAGEYRRSERTPARRLASRSRIG